MPNSDTRVGAEYWRLSIHDWNELLARGTGAEGGPDEPPKFKVLRGHPDVPLTPAPPIDLGWADDSEGAEASDPPALPAADELTALLHYSFGFSRVVLGPADIWPYHRFVASARCFFPTEMYVCLREGADVPAGIHHYDPLHHRLALLREGDWGGLVQQASRIRTDGAKYVLFLTSMFWKNAFRYRHYSYRLCSQEAGLVAGNVLAVAQALGLRTRVHYQFLDEPLNRLLGLSPGTESVMSLITLHPGGPESNEGPAPPQGCSAGPLCAQIPPLTQEWAGPWEQGARQEWSSTLDVDEHSRLEHTKDFTRYAPPVPTEGTGVGRVELPPPQGTRAPLSEALRRRHSGEIMFNPLPEDMPAAVFAEIICGVQSPYPSDTGPTPFPRMFVLVNAVDGVPPGLYETVPGTLALQRLPARPVPELLQELSVTPPSVNLNSANMVVYLVSDHQSALQRLGNRSYRILTQDAGVVAQRISLRCGSAGFAARIHNGFTAQALEEVLGLTHGRQAPLFQIVVGRRRNNGQYEPEILF